MGSLTPPMTDELELITDIASSFGCDLNIDADRKRAFPGHAAEAYGYVEMFSVGGNLAWTFVQRLKREYGNIANFWVHAFDDFGIGVLAYDASNALFKALGDVQDQRSEEVFDVWYTAEDVQAFYDDIVDRAFRKLRVQSNDAAPLTNEVASILFS